MASLNSSVSNGSDEIAPYRELAAAVLKLALDDARRGSPVQRAMARGWLLRSEAMAFWCAVAGVDVGRVRGTLLAIKRT